MRVIALLLSLLLGHDAFASDWQRDPSTVERPPVIKVDEPDAVTAGKPASVFQVRGFDIGMTLGQFSRQNQREFGIPLKGFIFSKAGFFSRDGSGCSAAGHSWGATDAQMTALAGFPGVRVQQSGDHVTAFDVTSSGALSIVDNVRMVDIAFSACVFGVDDKSVAIFDAVEALHPLPASCKRMVPSRTGEHSFCYVDGNLLSFTRYDSGNYTFWLLDPAYWAPIAEAAGVKPP